MADLSEYDILERQVTSKADFDFSRAVDKLIAEDNARALANPNELAELIADAKENGEAWRKRFER